jgi:hypothetical protein
MGGWFGQNGGASDLSPVRKRMSMTISTANR